MKAMILCAGVGSRLKPWTEFHPKALVPVGGQPMLKRVAERLIDDGFDELVVNVHHFSSQIADYIADGNIQAKKIVISDETEQLLDTGGGILHARRYLEKDNVPFLVHNVDILSNADLKGLYETHVASGRDVTLLISDRESDRRLVFSDDMSLKGWMNLKTGQTRPEDLCVESSDAVLAFSGIYVMSPSAIGKMLSSGFSGVFPIMDFFLSGLPEVNIGGVMQPGLELIDIGKPDTLDRANLSLQLSCRSQNN